MSYVTGAQDNQQRDCNGEWDFQGGGLVSAWLLGHDCKTEPWTRVSHCRHTAVSPWTWAVAGCRPWRQITWRVTVCLRVTGFIILGHNTGACELSSWPGFPQKQSPICGWEQGWGTGIINRAGRGCTHRYIYVQSSRPSERLRRTHFYGSVHRWGMRGGNIRWLHFAIGQALFHGVLTLPASGLCMHEFPQACCRDRGIQGRVLKVHYTLIYSCKHTWNW